MATIPATEEPTKSPVDFKKTMFKDVMLTDESSNIVSNNNKKITSRLQSIFGIPTVDITNHQMKVIAKSLGIKGTRKYKKFDVVDMIINWVSDKSNEIVEEISPDKEEIKDDKCSIKRTRYINVIFSDLIRPLIATRGQTLTKDQLTEGIKQDELLHTRIAEEYNKPTREYAANAHPDIELTNNDPAVYEPITWQKSKSTLTSLCSDYDKVFHNWKKSGFHGDFPVNEGADVGTEPNSVKKPFSDFAKGRVAILYMHRFLHNFPEFLKVITGTFSVLLNAFLKNHILTLSFF